MQFLRRSLEVGARVRQSCVGALMDDLVKFFKPFFGYDLCDFQKRQGALNLRIERGQNRDFLGHAAVQAFALLVSVRTFRGSCASVEQEYVFRAHSGALQPYATGFGRLEGGWVDHEAPDAHRLTTVEPVLDDGVAGELGLFTADLFGHDAGQAH